jgi:hypothetical protein
MPASYRWSDAVDCGRALKFRTPSMWLAKPDDHAGNGAAKRDLLARRELTTARSERAAGGKGMLLVKDQSELLNAVGACGSARMLVQRLVPDVLELDGDRWDLRAYLLIASAQPFFVFYHPGFARSARVVEGQMVLGDREVELEELQFHISDRQIAGARFLQTHVRAARLPLRLLPRVPPARPSPRLHAKASR